MTSHDALALLPAAADRVTAVVRGAPEDAWANPSPCEGWSARDVLGHLVSEHLWAPHLLRGESLAQVGDRYDGDVLALPGRPENSEAYAQRWSEVAQESMAAWADADPAAAVASSMGEQPVSAYAAQMLVDLTVHAWDLGRALGTGAELEPAAVEACLAYARENTEPGGTPGVFDAPVQLEDDATPQEQMLALFGRDPR